MAKTNRRIYRPCAAAAVLGCLAGGASHAQVSAAAGADDGGLLDEVTVTARRRAENIQTVPIAIDVVSQKALGEANVSTLADLTQLVPSITTYSSLSRDALDVSIRGQGSNGVSGLPGVISYLNEVPLAVDRAGNLSGGAGLLFDLENIQVLKGPQGTLFGKNTVGGALLLQSARPTNDFGGRIQLTYGNYNDREIDAAINLPIISDVLLARVALNGQLRDGFTFIQSEPGYPNGRAADARNNYSVRTSLDFHPAEAFQNDTIVTFTRFDSHGSPAGLSAFNPAGVVNFVPFAAAIYPAAYAAQQALGPRVVVPLDVTDQSSGKLLAISNTSRWSINDNLTFRNIVGYDDTSTTYEFDLDFTKAPVIANPSNPSTNPVHQFSDEAQLLGQSFDNTLNWIVGMFYLDQPAPDDYVLTEQVVFATPVDSLSKRSALSKALFGQGTYDLGFLIPKLKFTAGARYTWDNNDFQSLGGSLGSICSTQPTVNCEPTPDNRSADKALTWTLGLDYQLEPDTLLYLASRRGYRPGSSDTQQVVGFSPLYGPEYVTDGELGIKSDWRLGDVPVRTNADVYYQKYSDIQVSEMFTIPNYPAPVGHTANAAAAVVKGAEVEMSSQLTKDFQAGLNFDYLNFGYTEIGSLGAMIDSAQLVANVTNGRPRFKYGVNARYHLPLAGEIGSVSVRAGWTWQSPNGDTSQPVGRLDAYGLLNLSANWNGIYGKPFDVQLFASNALNKLYQTGSFLGYYQLGYSSYTYGEPRFYGVRLNYHFGGM